MERIAHAAFKLAQQRDRRLTSVDKSNVLEVSQLWREVVTRVGEEYPDVELSHMCAASRSAGQPKSPALIILACLHGRTALVVLQLARGSKGVPCMSR